jgi:hypothetical protein
LRARVLITAVAAAALLLSATSLASRATTQPAKKITLVVILDDKGVRLAAFTQLGQGSTATLNPLMGPVPRGDYVSINVYNRGSKAHNFSIFGKTTPSVKPGGKAHLFVAVMKRGSFPYGSTVDKSKAFRGILHVGDAGAAAPESNPAVG